MIVAKGLIVDAFIRLVSGRMINNHGRASDIVVQVRECMQGTGPIASGRLDLANRAVIQGYARCFVVVLNSVWNNGLNMAVARHRDGCLFVGPLCHHHVFVAKAATPAS